MNDRPRIPWHKTRAFKWAKELAILGLIFSAVTWYQTRNLLSRGTELPVPSLPQLDGQRVDFDSFRGKPTLLYFWAPWCGVCKANAHNVHATVGDDHHVASIALSYRDLGEVRQFATQYDMPRPVLLGGPDESTAFNISAFPTVYVLNPEGRVAFATMGYTSELGMRARLLAARWL